MYTYIYDSKQYLQSIIKLTKGTANFIWIWHNNKYNIIMSIILINNLTESTVKIHFKKTKIIIVYKYI